MVQNEAQSQPRSPATERCLAAIAVQARKSVSDIVAKEAEFLFNEPWRLARMDPSFPDLSLTEIRDSLDRRILRMEALSQTTSCAYDLATHCTLNAARRATDMLGFEEAWATFQAERERLCVRLEAR